jgi:alcohol dehydrogenase (cytochrome c)
VDRFRPGRMTRYALAKKRPCSSRGWSGEYFSTLPNRRKNDTPAPGEFYTAAPVAWDGRVYLGNAGSDYGGIGHIRAFDAKTGKRLWSFDTVPSTGDAAKTWPDDPKRVKAGGGTYSSYALDTEAGLLYSPVGNPGPDFVRGYRTGDNLYTSSVVALDAKTGELKGYHQLVRNDFHDWDVAASPILFTSKAGRKMVAAAGKNG